MRRWTTENAAQAKVLLGPQNGKVSKTSDGLLPAVGSACSTFLEYTF